MVDKRVNTACQVTDRNYTYPERELKKKKEGHRTGQLLKDNPLNPSIWVMSEAGKREDAEQRMRQLLEAHRDLG